MDKKKTIAAIFTWLLILFVIGTAGAQKLNPYFRKADRLYKDSSYAEAEEAYRKGQDHELPGFKGNYNIGNCLYQQGRADEAIDYYQKSLNFTTSTKEDQARAQYNLGNAYFQNKKFDKSVEAYREALKLNPKDNDARNNLVLAKQQLIQQQQQQQQQQRQQEQNKDQEKNKDQQKQSNQDQKQENKNPSNEEKQQQQQTTQDQDKQQQTSNPKLNKEQAEQIMRMIHAQDEKIRQRIQKAQSRSPKREKDW